MPHSWFIPRALRDQNSYPSFVTHHPGTCTSGGNVGMERGDAQIIPPPGVGKVPRKGEKRVVCWCTCSKILQAHHIAVEGGCGRG